jgi:deoxyribonuclease-4
LRGIRDVGEAVRQSARGLKLGTLRILLENTAGQGAALGWRMEELGALLDACAGLDVGACLDTAHLLAAGYDIRTAEGLEGTLQAVEKYVGLERVHVIHVNDSKVRLGARVDRHEHVGKGHIGLKAFARILNHPVLTATRPTADGRGLMRRAYILETPIDKPGDDARNVRALWALVGVRLGAVRMRPKKSGKERRSRRLRRSRKSRK